MIGIAIGLGLWTIPAALYAHEQHKRISRLEWALAVHSQRTGHADAVEEILTGKVEARTPRGKAFR